MNKGGIGVGSASIVLVFAVLCLTVFSLISLSSANADKALSNAAARMVKGYYEADTLAERILAEILDAEITPDSVLGIDIISDWDWDSGAEILTYSCPISETKELYVEVAVSFGTYDVLKWKMRNTGEAEWLIDAGMSIWPGF